MERLSSQQPLGSGRPIAPQPPTAKSNEDEDNRIMSSTSVATVQPSRSEQPRAFNSFAQPIHGNHSGSSTSLDRYSRYHDAQDQHLGQQQQQDAPQESVQTWRNADDAEEQRASAAAGSVTPTYRDSDIATHTTLSMNRGTTTPGVMPFASDPLALAAKRHKMNLSISNPPLRASVYSQLTQYSPVVEEATRIRIDQEDYDSSQQLQHPEKGRSPSHSSGTSNSTGGSPTTRSHLRNVSSADVDRTSVGAADGSSAGGTSHSSQTTPSVTLRSVSINKARSSVRELESMLTEIQTLRRSISDTNHSPILESTELTPTEQSGGAQGQVESSSRSHSDHNQNQNHNQKHEPLRSVSQLSEPFKEVPKDATPAPRNTSSTSTEKPLPEVPMQNSGDADKLSEPPSRSSSRIKPSLLKTMGGSLKRLSWRPKGQNENIQANTVPFQAEISAAARVKPLMTSPRHSRNVSLISQDSTASTYHSTQDSDMEDLKASIESYRATLNKFNGEQGDNRDKSQPDSAPVPFSKMTSTSNADVSRISSWKQIRSSPETEHDDFDELGLPPTMSSAADSSGLLVSSADSFQTAASNFDGNYDQHTLLKEQFEPEPRSSERNPETTLSASPGQSGNTVTAYTPMTELASPRTPRASALTDERPQHYEEKNHFSNTAPPQQIPSGSHASTRNVPHLAASGVYGEPSVQRKSSGKHRSKRASGSKVRSAPKSSQPQDVDYEGRGSLIQGQRSASMPGAVPGAPGGPHVSHVSTATHRLSGSRRAFSQQNIQELLEMADYSLQLDDIDLPPEERHLLTKFVDALSKLSIEISMDDGKRMEGKRRLHNALRAIEGWY